MPLMVGARHAILKEDDIEIVTEPVQRGRQYADLSGNSCDDDRIHTQFLKTPVEVCLEESAETSLGQDRISRIWLQIIHYVCPISPLKGMVTCLSSEDKILLQETVAGVDDRKSSFPSLF